MAIQTDAVKRQPGRGGDYDHSGLYIGQLACLPKNIENNNASFQKTDMVGDFKTRNLVCFGVSLVPPSGPANSGGRKVMAIRVHLG
jgi:hypothetical protein